MKTLKQIKEKAHSLGMSLVYDSVLRGNKERQIQQMIRWFQAPISWAVISDSPVNLLDRQRLNEFTTFIES